MQATPSRTSLSPAPDATQAVCVFCGSSQGVDEKYAQHARELGAGIARAKRPLVYGGGDIGLMGEIANAALDADGNVYGVIPGFLKDRELGHSGLTALAVVPDMLTRKRVMMENAHTFVALPGGFGTLDEIFEVLTWVQLEAMRGACYLINPDGFWDGLITQLDHMSAQGFISIPHRDLLHTVSSVEDFLAEIAA